MKESAKITFKAAQSLIGGNCVTIRKGADLGKLMYYKWGYPIAHIESKRGISYIYRFGHHYVLLSDVYTLGRVAALVKYYADKLDEQIKLIESKYEDDIAGAAEAEDDAIADITREWLGAELCLRRPPCQSAHHPHPAADNGERNRANHS